MSNFEIQVPFAVSHCDFGKLKEFVNNKNNNIKFNFGVLYDILDKFQKTENVVKLLDILCIKYNISNKCKDRNMNLFCCAIKDMHKDKFDTKFLIDGILKFLIKNNKNNKYYKQFKTIIKVELKMLNLF